MLSKNTSKKTVKIAGCIGCVGSDWPGYVVVWLEEAGHTRWEWRRCPKKCSHTSRAESIRRQTAAARQQLAAVASPARTKPPTPRRPPAWSGREALATCIERSRMHPVPRLEDDENTTGAYRHITRRMGGEHDWKAEQLPAGGQLLTLDHNGSYPAACGSVPLSPNRLAHTGPLDSRGARAGIFQVPLPAWTDNRIGHPLGVIATHARRHRRKSVWISTPHLLLLEKLHRAGLLEQAPTILDSYTGRSNSSLLTPFYASYREARRLAKADPDRAAYTAVKNQVGPTLALLWTIDPKDSFIHRPDWRVAMVAEAAVRHWVKAHAAVQAGAVLVRLGTVDETDWWTADGTLPPGYRLGTELGEVEVKPHG